MILQQTTRQDVDLHPSCDDHALLLEEIRQADVAAAQRRLEEHLMGSRQRMKLALTQPRR